MKRETIEDVVRMAVRVTNRMPRDGVQLHWSVTTEPCPPCKSEKDCAGSQLKPGKRR